MSDLLRSIVPFAAILIALVVAHELGHFFTAKLAGVKVLEFGVGYPPRIWGKRIGETEYTLTALPLGGFVRMLGETDAEEVDTSDEGERIGVMNTAAQQRSGEVDPRALAAKPAGIRIIVLLAGVIINALLPVLLFTISYMVPQKIAVGQAQITRVSANTPAANAGLQAGDVIRSINGRKVQSIEDVQNDILLFQGTTMTWQVERPSVFAGKSLGGKLVTVHPYARWAVPTEIEADGSKVKQGPTGIQIALANGHTATQQYSLWKAFPLGARETYDSFVLFKNQVISWVASKSAPEVAGPVGIAQATGQVVKEAGWTALIQLAALLSINLAIVNVLPLPMLDGGRVLFVLIELARRGKRIAPEKEALVHLVGFIVVISFVVVISFFDIERIAHGGSLFK
jgi:regulator of sigma E protease